MALTEHRATGPEYLELVTTLLQSARCSSPTGGLWEAADLQWWWRRDQQRDRRGPTFWLDDDSPVAAVVLHNWGERWECALLSDDHDCGPRLATLWPRALEELDERANDDIDLIVRDDDTALIEVARAAGFEASTERGVTCWMNSSERRTAPALAPGFELVDRTEVADRPHHMIPRNGEAIAARLAECSLYQPALDLAIYSDAGEVAAYGLFWADPMTGVGLVEPMRTEDRFQRRGLATHLFAAGLDRLAMAGAQRCKVSYTAGNEPAQRCYLGAGFHPITTDTTYRRSGYRRSGQPLVTV